MSFCVGARLHAAALTAEALLLKVGLCMWGHAAAYQILQERGGTLAEEPLGPQQRLKAILQEDRLDAPQPGSQASFRPNRPLPHQLVLRT